MASTAPLPNILFSGFEKLKEDIDIAMHGLESGQMRD